ncbi:MAG: DUF2252 domain-containing protein [Marinobacterium sp.]|nr:DUF2252 domain-containing protein [Marinobacterium sp.]
MKVLHTREQLLLTEIARFNSTLPDDARALKYQKMAASPFVFFRGTNHLFWQDMSHDWRISLFGGCPESQIWLQGDAHVYNFGALHDHYDRIYYGMDDFDDAVVADYQYDLWRLAVSMVLDLAEKPYYREGLADDAVKNLGRAYLKAVVSAIEDNPAARIEFAPKPIRHFLEQVHDKYSRKRMLKKWTCDNFSKLDPEHDKLDPINDDQHTALTQALQQYHHTRTNADTPELPEILDIAARQGAGTGSLGSQRYYALIAGETPKENLILDIKEQKRPASVCVMPEAEQNWYRHTFPHEGQRHARAFHAIAEHPDSWLGWLELGEQEFSVRERSPFKRDFPTEELNEAEYLHMASIWGEILGREHARGSAHVQEPDNRFIRFIRQKVTPDRKSFLRVLRGVALNYARRVDNDWKLFCDALER